MALTAIGGVPQWRWGSWLEQLPNSSYGAEHTGESGQANVKEAKSIKFWHQIQPIFHRNNISFTSFFLRQLTASDKKEEKREQFCKSLENSTFTMISIHRERMALVYVALTTTYCKTVKQIMPFFKKLLTSFNKFPIQQPARTLTTLLFPSLIRQSPTTTRKNKITIFPMGHVHKETVKICLLLYYIGV